MVRMVSLGSLNASILSIEFTHKILQNLPNFLLWTPNSPSMNLKQFVEQVARSLMMKCLVWFLIYCRLQEEMRIT